MNSLYLQCILYLQVGGDSLGTIPVKIDEFRHAKMKEMATKNNQTIQATYAEAVDSYLSGKYQDMILADSKLEQIITIELNKGINRLAAMLNSNNIDTSTILMAVMHLNSHIFERDRNEIYQAYRKEGSAYESAKRKK